MKDKKFIEMMQDDLVPDNKDKIKQRLGIYEVKKKKVPYLKPVLAFTMVLALCFGLYPIIKKSLTPQLTKLVGKTYVSFDVNPSMEFVVNEDKIVTTCIPKNNKAKTLLANNDLVGKSIEEVTNEVVSILNSTGYISITNKSNAIMVTTINEDKKSQEQIQKTINKELSDFFVNNHIFGVVINGENVKNNSLEDLANSYNISLGKMTLILTIINSYDPKDNNIPTIEELKDKKISELQDLLEDLDDEREEVLEDLEDDLEDLLDLIEEYYDKFIKEDVEDDKDTYSLDKIELENKIKQELSSLKNKWGELLDSIIIDFNEIKVTIENLKDLLEKIDDLDEDQISSLDSKNKLFQLKQLSSLKNKEINKVNKINKQECIDDFNKSYNSWLKSNKEKYEEDWFVEKKNWEINFDKD